MPVSPTKAILPPSKPPKASCGFLTFTIAYLTSASSSAVRRVISASVGSSEAATWSVTTSKRSLMAASSMQLLMLAGVVEKVFLTAATYFCGMYTFGLSFIPSLAMALPEFLSMTTQRSLTSAAKSAAASDEKIAEAAETSQ